MNKIIPIIVLSAIIILYVASSGQDNITVPMNPETQNQSFENQESNTRPQQDSFVLRIFKDLDRSTTKEITKNNLVSNVVNSEHQWMSVYGNIQMELGLDRIAMDDLWNQLEQELTIQQWQEIIDNYK